MAKSCRDKMQFRTKKDADEAAASYRQRVCLIDGEMSAYYCLRHLRYHIGHSRPKQLQADSGLWAQLFRHTASGCVLSRSKLGNDIDAPWVRAS